MRTEEIHHTLAFTPKKIFWGFLGLIFIAAVIWFGRFSRAPSPLPPQILAAPPSPFTRVPLASRAAYVLDAKTGRELWSSNGDAQLPLASLTKIMMAVTALSLVPESFVVTINPTFLEAEGDSGLYGNEQWRLKDLLDLTLLESSNDGANAIAATAGQVAVASGQVAGVADSLEGKSFGYDRAREQFVTAMNEQAHRLGLAQTYFVNPTGLDENADFSGGYGSARDVAVLFSHALHAHPTLFEATRYEVREFTSLSSLKHKVKNTNTTTSKIPSLLASKTGFTDLAGGNLVIAFDAGVNHPIVIVVLGSTEKGRFADAEKLVWATLDFLKS